ncbi:hypothetical protein SCE1572_25725 [Sorangium cellulosum So0157-2]|uniref:Uncharacterized protein n=1 Tax=Sorangium cellulosum So0157-2 TaxID=1254432 RepID=S4Y3X7_SORCE|nr:hypothetical protein SCE1572_25725 [Sorangium cellulosum So0157-2]
MGPAIPPRGASVDRAARLSTGRRAWTRRACVRGVTRADDRSTGARAPGRQTRRGARRTRGAPAYAAARTRPRGYTAAAGGSLAIAAVTSAASAAP